MTYQVLARKWRPKDFASLVGQEHVVRALTHALDGGRLHHAYLFTGTRGVGKTTLSRIFAKALNCETGVTSTPCGVCRACREIDEGRFVDYVEMDAASNRGVDEMAALLERAVYAPVDARFKVYMIDEVHMLTNHAFNAMLKTLEEPPAHVKFILATTDPQKIPVTVLSRCLQFNLKQMPAGHIVSHLEHILGEEHVPFDAQALRLLARAADGSMRDALSLTDQAIAYSANQVTEEAVRGMLGALDQSYLIRLLDALADGDGAGGAGGGRRNVAAQPVVFDRAAGSGELAAPDRLGAVRAVVGARRVARSGGSAPLRRSVERRAGAVVLSDCDDRPERAGPRAGRIRRLHDDAAAHAGVRAGADRRWWRRRGDGASGGCVGRRRCEAQRYAGCGCAAGAGGAVPRAVAVTPSAAPVTLRSAGDAVWRARIGALESARRFARK